MKPKINRDVYHKKTFVFGYFANNVGDLCTDRTICKDIIPAIQNLRIPIYAKLQNMPYEPQ